MSLFVDANLSPTVSFPNVVVGAGFSVAVKLVDESRHVPLVDLIFRVEM